MERASRAAVYSTFLFVDIVGLSDPIISTEAQLRKIELLNKFIKECHSYKTTDTNDLLILPTGDGMAIGFLKQPDLPLRFAIELHRKLDEYNQGKNAENDPLQAIKVRIGIHGGPVFRLQDIQGNENIWGPGIVTARRIMDLGEEGHILLSARIAEDLRELSDYYKQIIHAVGIYSFKHGQNAFIYSAYGEGFGNPKPPSKDYGYETLRILRCIEKLVVIDEQNMLIHYSRSYDIKNMSENLIFGTIHSIQSDIKINPDKVNLKVYSCDGEIKEESKNQHKSMAIPSMFLPNPHRLEFTVVFDPPLNKDGIKSYTIEYDVQRHGRATASEITHKCDYYEFIFDFPASLGIGNVVKVAEINLLTVQESATLASPVIKSQDNRRIAKWSTKNIPEGKAFEFRW
jgi:Adenylate and Guanylate cyclase catalytic domain